MEKQKKNQQSAENKQKSEKQKIRTNRYSIIKNASK